MDSATSLNPLLPEFYILWEAASRHVLPQADSEDNAPSAVVCTLNCDEGEIIARKIIHEGRAKNLWSRAEDYLVDWLRGDVTSQRSQIVDVTMYFSSVPLSTTADGIRLWLNNLRMEGKRIGLTIKVASCHQLESKCRNDNKGNNNENAEVSDVLQGLRRLKAAGVTIEPMSAHDWEHLILLMVDKSNLRSLESSLACAGSKLGTA